MFKIAELTLEIINTDQAAYEALSKGFLNLSAYAKHIKPIIEKRLYKPVNTGSIVTALSRLSETLTPANSLRVPVRIEDMSIKSPLCEISYERTRETAHKIAELSLKYAGQRFFTITQGVGEVTIISSQISKDEILELVNVKPRGQYDNLSAITVRFNEKDYIEVPNMLYTMVSALAAKHVNLIEIVSTFTEISFIVKHIDMKQVIDIFKENFLTA